MLTLADVQNSQPIKTVAGFTPTSQQFIDLVNNSVRRLLKKGDWYGTVVPIQTCIQRGCVVWPRYVQQVRAVNICNQVMPVENLWYRYLPYGRGREGWRHWCGRELVMYQDGMLPTYNPIYDTTSLLHLAIDKQDDVGATLTVFGIDTNGQPLSTDNGNGTWSDGIILTAAMPYVRSAIPVARISRVIKSKTQGLMRLYSFDTSNNSMIDLAVYEPSETEPSYQRYQVTGGFPWFSTNCPQCRSVIALVKLKYIPAQSPNDLIIIDNEDALALMINGIKREQAGDVAGLAQFETMAVNDLNLQLRDNMPLEQVPVRVNSAVAANNRRGLGRAIGRIM